MTLGRRDQRMFRRRSVVALGVFALTFVAQALRDESARAAGNPYLQWWTLETAHFRVHYYKGLEPVAERIASIAEGINQRLSTALGHELSDVTHIVVSDHTDDANGYADSVPYNAIHVWATAPEDLSALGDYDDWQLTLVTHEHAHVIHTDTVSGIPALANRIAGKWWLPNRAQPKWILEGLAVFEESAHTTGGRGRSSIFDMYMRADVLEHRVAPLDQMSHFVRRWPQGNLWYLYGSRFLGFIANIYGESSLRAAIADYGDQVAPFAINRSIRRATGRTYEELYEGWKADLESHYGAQSREVQKRGVREGVRLTNHGQMVGNPRFLPAARRKSTTTPELLYFRDNGHSRPGFYRLPLTPGAPSSSSDDDLVVRVQGHGSASITNDGRMLFNSVAISNRIYAYNDLFLLPPGAEAPNGFEPERKRLTEGGRTEDPDVSRDGTRVVFTENHRGTRTLMIARLTDAGAMEGVRALVPSARTEQAYTPRFSPDGKWVAYSVWTDGGYRDIRLVDVATGQFFEMTHDRAMDWEPSFSPDGRYVYFASDRALGIPNIFAFDRREGKLWQVTNVLTGAFYPEISPDGKTLVYSGYTSYGHDLFAMAIDEKEWLVPPPIAKPREDAPSRAPAIVTSRHPYNPLPTLRPRAWRLDAGPGTFGSALAISTTATDAVGLHSLSASVLVETERGDPQGAIGYAYQRLPFDFSMSFQRSLTPVRYRDDRPIFIRESLGLTTALGYALPGEFDGNNFSLSYSLSRLDGAVRLPTPDPDAMLGGEPIRGQLGSVRLGWSYSNAETYLRGIAYERGFTLSASANMAAPPLASDYTLYIFSYSAAEYIPMPWARHHTLSLRQTAGIATGNYPYRGVFYTGGFIEAPLFRLFSLGDYQGPFVLRGYPAYSFAGSQYHLYSAEYRFPILNLDRGLSTVPAFVHRINGNFFADYGGAFDQLDLEKWRDQLHLGVGVELWIDFTVSYAIGGSLRIGHARGVSDRAAAPGGQTYAVLALPF